MRPLPRSPFVSTRDAVFASARRPSISTRRNRLQERRETAVLYPLPRPEPALMRFGGSVQGLGRPPGQAVEDLLPSSASSRSHFSGMRVHGKESRARPPGAGSSIVGGGARSSLPASATEIRTRRGTRSRHVGCGAVGAWRPCQGRWDTNQSEQLSTSTGTSILPTWPPTWSHGGCEMSPHSASQTPANPTLKARSGIEPLYGALQAPA